MKDIDMDNQNSYLTQKDIEEMINDPAKKQGLIISLLGNFEYFCRVVSLMTVNKELVLLPFHDIVLKKLQDITLQNNKKRNLAICMPVGGGKSLISQYWICWCFFRNKNLTFLYVSHNDDLITKRSQEVKETLTSDFIRKLIPLTLRKDDRAKAKWSIDGGVNKSGLAAVSMGSGITGLDCFDYDEMIATDRGWLKIGQIVTLKLDVKILSYNINKNINEYKSIKKYIEKNNSDIIELVINNGLIIKCTPEHYFYTQRGYVKAKELLYSDVFLAYNADTLFKEIKPLSVKIVDNNTKSYCISVCDNHNMYIGGENLGILASNCGNPSVEGFSGALVCFPYDEVVWTENGKIKIGEIVEKKLRIKVYSFNHELNKVELQDINNFITNKDDDILRITFNDLSYIECTPDHRIFTLNRGYIEVQDLLTSDIIPPCPFKHLQRNIKLFANIFSFAIFIVNYCNFFVSKIPFYSRFIINNIFCKLFPIFTLFNLNYIRCTNIKFFGYFTNSFSRFGNFNSLKSSQDISRSFFMKRKCTMFDGILHIVRFISVGKIFQTIIKFISVKMSDSSAFFLNSYKSQHQGLVKSNAFTFCIFIRKKSQIASTICLKLYYFLFNKALNFIIFIFGFFNNDSSVSSNFSCNGNTIKTFPSSYRKPLFIVNIGHVKKTYCLSIRLNHNLYVGKSQAVLVRNCDDPIDIKAAASFVERRNVIEIYNGKLHTRRRTMTTPTVLIMQRVHVDDLVGWIKNNEPDEWDIVSIAALDEETNKSFWPERYPIEELERLRNLDAYNFSSLYQQNPIVEGGNLIKEEWFQYYDSYGLIKFKKIFITSDTAQKTAEHNDYSVFCVWGVNDAGLYLLDMFRGKWEAPDLKKIALSVWSKWKVGLNGVRCSALYVEDKSSGTGLIQEIKREFGIPIMGIPRNSKKVDRVKDILTYIESGRIFLPRDNHAITNPLISEAKSFTSDNTHEFDDIVDNVVDGIVIGFNLGGKVSSLDPRVVGSSSGGGMYGF